MQCQKGVLFGELAVYSCMHTILAKMMIIIDTVLYKVASVTIIPATVFPLNGK